LEGRIISCMFDLKSFFKEFKVVVAKIHLMMSQILDWRFCIAH